MFHAPTIAVVAAPYNYVGLTMSTILIILIIALVLVVVFRVLKGPAKRARQEIERSETPKELEDVSPDVDRASLNLKEEEVYERDIHGEEPSKA